MLTIPFRKQCLFLRVEPNGCRYLAVRHERERLRVTGWGTITIDEDDQLAERVKAELASRKIDYRDVVLMLPRSDLELTVVKLPPATLEELPELVSNVLASSHEDPADAPIVDFLVTRDSDSEGLEALAFQVASATVDDLTRRFRSQGMHLRAITSSGFGSVELLRLAVRRSIPAGIVVTMQGHEIDLAVVVDDHPTSFRTLPRLSVPDVSLTDVLATEIDRTLTSIGQQRDGSVRGFLIGSVAQNQELAGELAERLGISVSVIEPSDYVHRSPGDTESLSDYAGLIGMAHAWRLRRLPIDLLHPKRPPAVPGPGRRVAMWAAIVLTAVGVGGYELWSQQRERAAEIQGRREALARWSKRADQIQDLAYLAGSIENWQTSEVNWLDELYHLSQAFPPADKAVVRHLTMGMQAGGRGYVDLAVQVAAPEVRSAFEDALRDSNHSVISNRASAASQQQRFPWQFDARVELALPHQHSGTDLETTERSGGETTEAMAKP